jgi:hypothetical protein
MNRYQEILENNINFPLVSVAIKNLIREDDEAPAKVSMRLIDQYNNCKNDSEKKLFDSLTEAFTDRTFLEVFKLILEHSDVNKDLSEDELEDFYFGFTELLEEKCDDEVSSKFLTILSKDEDIEAIDGYEFIDEFLIDICGYSINTILDYMENRNNDLVIEIPRF